MKYGIILVFLPCILSIALYGRTGVQRPFRNAVQLNRGWQFRRVGEVSWLPASVPGTVHTDLVGAKVIGDPFYRTNEKDLQWIDKTGWEYRTVFHVDDAWLERENMELVFKGLDTYADVFLNDALLFRADNMFREWRADCKPILKKGDNVLRVVFRSPVEEDIPKLDRLGYPLPAVNDQSENGGLGDKKISPFARKAGYHYGWDWGPRFVTSGIWRPVTLEAWDSAKIEDLHVRLNRLSDHKAALSATFSIRSTGTHSAALSLSDAEKSRLLGRTETPLSPGLNAVTIDFEIADPELWWTNGLGKSHLYRLNGTLALDGRSVDESSARVGIRTLKLVQEKDAQGRSFYFELNGIPVFMKGANYIPNDNFLPSVSPGEYEEVIRAAAESHMNMLRVWGGGVYENDLFYDLCDRYGILVWQDFMFACAMYPGDDAFVENVRQEAIQNVKRLRNHPCMALWCGNNEIDAAWGYGTDGGWGWKEKYPKDLQDKLWGDYRRLFHDLLPDIVRQFGGGIDYWPSSPMAGPDERAFYEATSGDIHYWGVWHGKEPFENYARKIGRFMSEYGFQSFPEMKTVKAYTVSEDWDIRSGVMEAHQRSGKGNALIETYMDWYYRRPKDFESFLYMSQVLQAEGVKTAVEAHRRKKPYCMGTLYWQLNDCWPVASWSSMDYYRRWKALHYFVRKAYDDVLVSPVEDGGVSQIWIVSDRLDSVAAEMNVVLTDLSGNVAFREKMPVSIPPNSSRCVFTRKTDEWLAGLDRTNAVLSVEVAAGQKKLSINRYYFAPIKSIDLPTPRITKTVKRAAGGYAVTLKADQLAKNVFLQLDEAEGFFSDNYFDLMPGETRVVHFTTSKRIEDFVDRLKIRSVADSY